MDSKKSVRIQDPVENEKDIVEDDGIDSLVLPEDSSEISSPTTDGNVSETCSSRRSGFSPLSTASGISAISPKSLSEWNLDDVPPKSPGGSLLSAPKSPTALCISDDVDDSSEALTPRSRGKRNRKTKAERKMKSMAMAFEIGERFGLSYDCWKFVHKRTAVITIPLSKVKAGAVVDEEAIVNIEFNGKAEKHLVLRVSQRELDSDAVAGHETTYDELWLVVHFDDDVEAFRKLLPSRDVEFDGVTKDFSRYPNKYPILGEACMKGRTKIARYLVADVKCDPNVPHGKGLRSPLQLAAFYGFEDIVRSLLEHGAKSNLRDLNGESPIQAAMCAGHSQIADMIKKMSISNERERQRPADMLIPSNMPPLSLGSPKLLVTTPKDSKYRFWKGSEDGEGTPREEQVQDWRASPNPRSPRPGPISPRTPNSGSHERGHFFRDDKSVSRTPRGTAGDNNGRSPNLNGFSCREFESRAAPPSPKLDAWADRTDNRSSPLPFNGHSGNGKATSCRVVKLPPSDMSVEPSPCVVVTRTWSGNNAENPNGWRAREAAANGNNGVGANNSSSAVHTAVYRNAGPNLAPSSPGNSNSWRNRRQPVGRSDLVDNWRL